VGTRAERTGDPATPGTGNRGPSPGRGDLGAGGRDPGDGTSSIRGVVVDADDQAVVLEVEGSQVAVPLSEVVRGKVVLPW
jgi:hypothetical protein